MSLVNQPQQWDVQVWAQAERQQKQETDSCGVRTVSLQQLMIRAQRDKYMKQCESRAAENMRFSWREEVEASLEEMLLTWIYIDFRFLWLFFCKIKKNWLSLYFSNLSPNVGCIQTWLIWSRCCKAATVYPQQSVDWQMWTQQSTTSRPQPPRSCDLALFAVRT